MTTLYFHGSDDDFSHSVSGTREQMDCKEEITDVIMLVLVRDLLQMGTHESNCRTCGVRGEKIGCIFKMVPEDSK